MAASITLDVDDLPQGVADLDEVGRVGHTEVIELKTTAPNGKAGRPKGELVQTLMGISKGGAPIASAPTAAVPPGRLAASGAAASFCATSNLFLGSGLFDVRCAAEVGMRVGIGTDVGAGTSFSMLRTLDECYKVAQMAGHRLAPLRAFYLATLGGARSLYLDDSIGNFAAGKYADFVVLDPRATPLLARRMAQAQALADRLFLLMTLGDDRAVAATYVAGRAAHRRPALSA